MEVRSTSSSLPEAETTTAAPSQPEPAAVPVRFEVVVNPATLEVQRGQSYDLVCYVYGADESTIIYWIQDEPERVGPDDERALADRRVLALRSDRFG